MDKLRVGIIGMGNIGTVHAKTLAGTEGVEIAALCDADASRLAEKAAVFGVRRTFTDHREMLAEKLDAVFVCSPNAQHGAQALAALQSGVHVFCEKPMALDAAEASRMVAAAKEARRILQIGMMWRQKPESRFIRGMVERGEMGEVYHARVVLRRRRGIPGLGGWFTTKSLSGGGALIDIGVHFLDLAMHLAGAWEPERVSAATYDKFGTRMGDYRYVSMWAGPPRLDGTFDVDDAAAGFVRFRNGPTLAFEIAWAGNNQEDTFVEILGSKGGVRAFGEGPLTVYTETADGLADVVPVFGKENAFELQAKHFVRAVRGEGAPVATGEEGLAVMKLIDAIYESGRTGREVVLGRRNGRRGGRAA